MDVDGGHPPVRRSPARALVAADVSWRRNRTPPREQGADRPADRRRPSVAALLAAGLSPILARVYAARGIGAASELDHALSALPPFGTLRGIAEAAVRLARAIAARERIVVVADYDADGATACAVAVRGLSALGADVGFIVPNRFEFGYGLTPEIVALAAQRAPDLLVTVDNGIASVEGVAAAAARGIDVLVTDHHLPGPALPSPAIIVNPNQPGCAFPSKHIAGVGVMFYVVTATRALLRERGAFAGRPAPNLADLLDLVALGTVADVVRLDQTNRVFVEQGLARLRARPRAARRPRAVRGRGPRPGARDRVRPGLRRGSRVSTRPAGWPTCRSASAACSPTTTARRRRWPRNSTG